MAPDTPIDEIAVRPQARRALRERGIYWLEDLCAISERELLREKAIGTRTLSALRAMLAAVGLDFLPNPAAQVRALDRSRIVLALHREARQRALQGLEDSAYAAALGLRGRTLNRVLGRGCETVGQLRRLSLDQLRQGFGKREGREIYMALAATQRPFASAASQTELWRHGLLDAEDLSLPTHDWTPTADLQPWLGPVVPALVAHGIGTLGELRALAKREALTTVPGLGRARRDRVQHFLRACATRTAAGLAGEPSAAPSALPLPKPLFRNPASTALVAWHA